MKNFYKGGRGLSFFRRQLYLFNLKNNCRLTTLHLPIVYRRAAVCRLLTIFVFSLFSHLSDARAQSVGKRTDASRAELNREVSIGHSVPKDFWTREHLFFINGDTVRKSLSESKGKMLVVDFWFSGCSPCLLHQKSIKEYAERYKDKLSVVMVNSKNTKDSFEKLKSLYENGFFKRFGIENIETIILDEYLMSIFPYTSFPHYVWINEIGRLQLRTFRNLLDKDYVAPFVSVQQ